MKLFHTAEKQFANLSVVKIGGECPSELRSAYAKSRRKCAAAARRIGRGIKASLRSTEGDRERHLIDLTNYINGYLSLTIKHIKTSVRNKYLPDWLPRLEFNGERGLYLEWSKLSKSTVNGHSVIQGESPPNIILGGGSWKLGWSPHALERLLERRTLNDPRRDYGSLADVHIYVKGDKSLRYEAERDDEEPTVSVWAKADDGGFDSVVAVAVLKKHPPAGTEVMTSRLPCVQNGPWLVAKTLLPSSFGVFPRHDVRNRCLDFGYLASTSKNNTVLLNDEWAETIQQIHAVRPLVRINGEAVVL